MEKYLIGLLLACSIVNAQTVSVSPFPASLTTQVTGTLPVANGGTGVTTSTGTGNAVLSASPTLSGVAIIPNSTVANVTASTASTTSSFLANNNLTSATAYDFYANSVMQSTVTTTGIGYRSAIGTLAASFTMTTLDEFLAQDGAKGAGSTITNNHGFNCLALTNGTNNYCFRGQTAAGANNYNLYMDGTAKNYMAGALQVKNLSYIASAPTISACGTSPSVDANANNNAGTVTVGTVAAASCTITFSAAFTTYNHCRITSQSNIAGLAYSYTLSAITVTGTSLIGDLIDYECDGV